MRAEEYLTTSNLAARWKLHPRTLAGWRAKRYGPRFKKIGKSVRYPIKSVIEWEKKHWG